MGSRERFGKQQLNAARFEDARNQARRSEHRQKHSPGIEERRDPAVDTAHQAVHVGVGASLLAEQRDGGRGARRDVDPQEEQEKQNQQSGETEQHPEYLSGQGLAEGIGDESQRHHYLDTVRTKTSSSVLVVG